MGVFVFVKIYFRGTTRKTTQTRKPSTVAAHAHERQRKAETPLGDSHKPHEKSTSQLEFEHETFGRSQLVVESTKTHSIVARAWRWQRIACAQHCRVAAVAARARAAQEIDRVALERELRGDTRGHTRVVPTLCAHRANAQDSPRRLGSTDWRRHRRLQECRRGGACVRSPQRIQFHGSEYSSRHA